MARKLRWFAFPLALALGGLAMTAGCALTSTRAASFLARVSAKESRAEKRAELAAHRKQQLARLHAYAEAGLFPLNPNPTPGPVHMFKDAAGTRCAVANLIHLDGHDDLVDRMATERNDVVVADETSGPLHDWVLTSGLTNEEVRRVQGVGFEFAFEGPLPRGVVAFSEQERIRAHLRAVEVELIAATEESLDVAMNRLGDSRLALR